MHRDTDLQHFGEDRDAFRGSITPPIFRTSLFSFPDCEALEAGFRRGERDLYSRVSNPTVRALEVKIAALEAADEAIAFASGMGAISAVLLTFLRRGDHLVCCAGAYAPTLSLVHRLERDWGVDVTLVSPRDMSRVEEFVRDTTRLIYLESPASLTFEVSDLEHVARVARRAAILTVADNSWATPLCQQPRRLGVDLVVHSGTKYLSGHSDLLLGLVAGSAESMARIRSMAPLLGACLSPEDAFLALRGLRTLHLRLRRHETSAYRIARRLLEHDRVLDVLYPPLPFFPSHSLWKRQFEGASGLLSFRLRGDPRRFCDALTVFSLGVSWGGFESLALPHAVVVAAEPPRRTDIPDDLIRLSIGLEDPDDLWRDLERGFAAVAEPPVDVTME